MLATTRFDAAQSLEDTLSRYVRLYNHQIPQRALGHIAPVQALQDWQEKCAELFKKGYVCIMCWSPMIARPSNSEGVRVVAKRSRQRRHPR